MEPVTLFRCARCRLEWVRSSEKVPGFCPQCRKSYSVPTEIVIAGHAVEVTRVFDYGSDEGICDKRVRHGLDVLKLGDRCSHGWISYLLCPTCNPD